MVPGVDRAGSISQLPFGDPLGEGGGAGTVNDEFA